jgi:hypothetical protein
MDAKDFIELIQEVRADFSREKDQGLMQDSLSKAQQALAGEYACDRILRKVEAREKIHLLRSTNAGRAR